MKISRKQLRKLINEAILNEAEFVPQGAGKYGRMAGSGIGAALGAFGGGVGAGVGLGIGTKASDFIANQLGYQGGDIPKEHPLHPANLHLEYGVTFSDADELLDYLESFEGDKFKSMYHVEDFQELGEVAAETLRLLGEAGRVLEGFQAALSTANAMQGAGFTGAFGLGDKKVRGRLGRAKDSLLGLFGGDDEEIALADDDLSLDLDLQKKTS